MKDQIKYITVVLLWNKDFGETNEISVYKYYNLTNEQ